ncbi:MAG: dihydroneopterin aldolase [Cytophagaceae bacterium]|jgi:dihydroneopterin aldolase|nr:dihydroneopterin aldolase [Cytophagaceae bacterium]
MSYEIKLEEIEFHAFHGVYDYEQQAGNTFVLDLSVRFSLSRLPLHDNIEEAPDYQMLYHIAAEEMKVSSKLLETVALSIHKKVWKAFPDASHVRVSIKKLNPPIGNPCKASAVVLESDESF